MFRTINSVLSLLKTRHKQNPALTLNSPKSTVLNSDTSAFLRLILLHHPSFESFFHRQSFVIAYVLVLLSISGFYLAQNRYVFYHSICQKIWARHANMSNKKSAVKSGIKRLECKTHGMRCPWFLGIKTSWCLNSENYCEVINCRWLFTHSKQCLPLQRKTKQLLSLFCELGISLQDQFC